MGAPTTDAMGMAHGIMARLIGMRVVPLDWFWLPGARTIFEPPTNRIGRALQTDSAVKDFREISSQEVSSLHKGPPIFSGRPLPIVFRHF